MKLLITLTLSCLVTLAGFGQKISDLPSVTTPAGTDVLPVVNGGATKKITRTMLTAHKADTTDNATRSMVAATIGDSLDERANDYLKNADSADVARRTWVSAALNAKLTTPDTSGHAGEFLQYTGEGFDWAVAGSDSGNFAKLSGGNIFSGAQNATDFRASDSVTANVVKSVTTTTDTLKATSIYIALSGRFRSIYGGTFGYMSYDTIVYNASGNPSATTNMIQLGPVSVIHAQGLDFSTLPIRSSGGRFKFSDWNRELVGNGRPHIEGASAPHQLLIFERGGPATYLSNDDLAVTGFNYTTNSNLATQAAAVKGIDVRNNIGGAHPLGVYTANGSYTPAQAFGGHFELNNYARAKIPIGYGVRARVNNAHSNDSTRYGFAAGFKYSQPSWAYGGYDTLYGIHLDDPKYGDVRAAIGLRDTGLIAWKWDTFLKRTGAGTLRLDTNLTAKNIRSDDTLQASKAVLVGNVTGRAGDTSPSMYLVNTTGDANNRGVIQEYLNSLNLISQSNTGAATGTLVTLSTQRAGKGFPSRGGLVVDTLQRVIIGQYSTPVSHRADSSLTVHPNQPMDNTGANPHPDSLTGGGGHFYGGLQIDKGLNVNGATRLATSLTGILRADAGVVSTTTIDSANFVKKNVDRVLFYSGLIDSVKTTDTVYIGDIYPAMTISKIKYHATRDVELTIKIEMVDSLTQTSGATLIDTTTCINSVTLQETDEDIDEVSLVEGKILRYVFAAIGTMPKHFAFSIIGRE